VAGFKTGLSLSAKASLGGYGSEVSASDLAVYKQALNDNMKNSDWSVAFGGAVRFGMAQVDLRYTLGILDISKEPSGATSVTLKNTALQLTTGVVF
jgi:hypothetical protein